MTDKNVNLGCFPESIAQTGELSVDLDSLVLMHYHCILSVLVLK